MGPSATAFAGFIAKQKITVVDVNKVTRNTLIFSILIGKKF
jgi:hypothetical protein